MALVLCLLVATVSAAEFSNSLPICGDGLCDVGEDTENCCLDCGCPVSGQECSANSEYPNGLCHVCGDGVQDPVENGTNCCVDAGCPAGLECDPSINIPYGKCEPPPAPEFPIVATAPVIASIALVFAYGATKRKS